MSIIETIVTQYIEKRSMLLSLPLEVIFFSPFPVANIKYKKEYII